MLYTWNCAPCATEPHYITEPYVNCSAANGNYTAEHSEIVGVIDAYEHYLLYQLVIGWAYHSEYCTPPPPPPAVYGMCAIMQLE